MKSFLSLGLVMTLSSASLFADAEKLYQFEGKTYTTQNLTPAMQQAVFEIQNQSYQNMKKVVDAQLLTEHIASEAKKKNLSIEKYEEQVFKTKMVSDADAKKWFDENKSRIGNREFESIKSDIKQLLQSQENEKVRTALLDKLKASGKFQLALAEPVAPTMDIAYQGFPTRGSDKAKVRIIEFADFNCPHCKSASKVLKSLVDKYKDKVQFVYLDFPIDRSGVSKKVAEGGVCADKQKKYWEYHYLAFGEDSLTNNSAVDFAKKLKLDVKAFESCLSSAEPAEKVNMARSEGERIGIDGTPTIYFNGKKVLGHNEKSLEEALKKLL